MDKKKLHQKCVELVNSRIGEYQKRSEEFQQAANQETKSSAGDKYETGRAMMQLEKDKVASQLSEVLKLKKVLDQIDPTKPSTHGELGSLIITNVGKYYLSTSLGKVSMEDEDYFCLSPVAPFGQALIGKGVGDEVVFNGKSSKIIELY